MGKKIKIGGLISGTGTNMDAIIRACESGKIDGEVIFVGADNPDAKGLKKAEKKNIPTVVVDYSKIIRAFKKNPEPTGLPDDFDLDEIISKQSFFSDNADSARVTEIGHCNIHDVGA